MLYESNDEAVIEMLQKRPGVAAELLNMAIQENIPEELAIVIRQIRAAGYDVSVTAKPKPASKPTPRTRTKPGATKKVTHRPTGRGQARRSTAIA